MCLQYFSSQRQVLEYYTTDSDVFFWTYECLQLHWRQYNSSSLLNPLGLIRFWRPWLNCYILNFNFIIIIFLHEISIFFILTHERSLGSDDFLIVTWFSISYVYFFKHIIVDISLHFILIFHLLSILTLLCALKFKPQKLPIVGNIQTFKHVAESSYLRLKSKFIS